MLEKFEKSVLDDPEYKEDAVREDIITPALKKLGYSASGTKKMVRSRNLSHPFVNIGSKRNKINIIPDYILEINGETKVIIDAKSPQTSLQQTKHAEQAYSYAIHPEIRASIYSLCNGKEWIIWDIDKFDPIAIITIEELINNFQKLKKFLSPDTVLHPEKRNFLRDFGLTILKSGFADDSEHHFIANQIGNIGKVGDNLYTANVQMLFDDDLLAISFDMNESIYLKLLSFFPKNTQLQITKALSQQPYSLSGFTPIWVTISGTLGVLQKGKSEDFIPIIVESIKPIAINA